CDGQPVVVEVAAPFRDRHRQIIEMRLVGDPKLKRGAFKLLPMADRDRAEQQACEARDKNSTGVLQFCHRALPKNCSVSRASHCSSILGNRKTTDSKRASPWAWRREREITIMYHQQRL